MTLPRQTKGTKLYLRFRAANGSSSTFLDCLGTPFPSWRRDTDCSNHTTKLGDHRSVELVAAFGELCATANS
jgi:hypothetical protein